MPRGLRRYHESGQSHFVTFSCYRRKPKFSDGRIYDLFPVVLEEMRLRFRMRIYGYVVMPEHVHLLVSEPEDGTLADAMHYLKLSFSKRARSLTATQVSVRRGREPYGKLRAGSGAPAADERLRARKLLAKEILRPERAKRARVWDQIALSSSQSREARFSS